jgi:hypothetical protein
MLKLKHKVMAGLALSVILPAFLSLPADAKPPVAVRGVITKMDGDNVTIKQPWGDEVTVEVSYGRRNRVFREALEVGMDVAFILDPDSEKLVARKLCTRILPAPPFVAVEPLKVPPSAPPPPMTPRPVAPPTPPAPPRILFY